jgi:two-component system, chemotaxis family, CheB/CheR fusion protein
VHLSSVIAAAMESTQPQIAQAGHSLHVDVPQQDIELNGDPLRLVQVVANLLTNAIKYTPHGGKIALRARLNKDRLELSVKDSGLGMDPSRIEDMFEMFAQGGSDEDRSQGLGIGLALVKNIVELHGGHVTARSEGPGKGSEFLVSLPGARTAFSAPPKRAPAPAPVAPIAANDRRGLILIADDNVDAGWGMAKLLEMVGYETTHVRGGQDAVREIARLKPQAGIIDIGMPDLNGHEVARQVRAMPGGRETVLIAATGWGQEADEREAVDAGFDAHMTKPVDMQKLSDMLGTLLSSKASVK